ncbi:hypothetical protein BDZ45DRAFT_683874 [Acephala macrosclerotiorum]|nr:hypothetical protein BDZ45DRAFT_683874 [Acephala macrosclerotiorum]
MPPKATLIPKDRIQDLQLLYAMLLEFPPISGSEAWSRVSARIPDCADGGARMRWNRLKAKWDAELLFGENHFETIDAAEVRRAGGGQTAGRKEKKAVEGVKRGKAVRKKKAVEVKKEPIGSEDEDRLVLDMDVDERVNSDEDEMATELAMKKKAGRPKKQQKKPIKVIEIEDEVEEEESAEALEDLVVAA